jgi:hypothetical protein
VRILPFRGAAGVATIAGLLMLLAPAPAHAEFVCWMSDGIRYCYDPNDGRVPVEPDPAPTEPLYVPTPPAAPVEQPWIQPVPVEPAPVQHVPAPANPVPAPLPVPVNPVPVAVYVPPQSGGYYDSAAQAPVAVAEVPAEPAAEVAALPAEPAASEVTDAAPVPTVSASTTAAASPSPSSSASGVASLAGGQASGTEPSNVPPLVLLVGGVLLAAALAWFVPPVRLALARMARAK